MESDALVNENQEDPIWNHFVKIENSNSARCLACNKVYKAYKIKRLKQHLAGFGKDVAKCKEVTNIVSDFMKKQLNGEGVFDDTEKMSGLAIGRFFMDTGIPFDTVNSPYFQPMIDAINSQKSRVVAPTTLDLYGWILRDLTEKMDVDFQNILEMCAKDGCSVLIDNWAENEKMFTSFSVYCCEQLVILNNFSPTEIESNGSNLFSVLRNVIEMVGARNVVQILARNNDCFKDAIKKVSESFPNIFWTPCGVDCVELILKDLMTEKWIKPLVEDAKSITRFIYNNNAVWQILKSRTSSQLLIPGLTNNSADFFTLRHLVELRNSFKKMVETVDWMDLPETETEEGLATKRTILDNYFWSQCKIAVSMVEPLLILLKTIYKGVGSNLGCLCAAVYQTKERIKNERPIDYARYWKIIDVRCRSLHLHVACFYLDPKFFRSSNEQVRVKARSSLFSCIEKFDNNQTETAEAVTQIEAYHLSRHDFGRKLAQNSSYPPDLWWSLFGGHCPELLPVAKRILTQPCSLVCLKPKKVLMQQLDQNNLDGDQQAKMKKRFYRKELRDTIKEWVHENGDTFNWSVVDLPENFDKEDHEIEDPVFNDVEMLTAFDNL